MIVSNKPPPMNNGLEYGWVPSKPDAQMWATHKPNKANELNCGNTKRICLQAKYQY